LGRRVNVGTRVAVGKGVKVPVLVGRGVLVAVPVGVVDGVKEAITNEVLVGSGVAEGRRVGWSWLSWSKGVGVQVGGNERTRVVAVAVGMEMKMVGRVVGAGKGLSAPLSSNNINPKTPHKQKVNRIITTDRMSQSDNFTAILPFLGNARLVLSGQQLLSVYTTFINCQEYPWRVNLVFAHT
jgi:hypothetical protein